MTFSLATVVASALIWLSLCPSSSGFGPPINADPGAGEPFSSPESEFDDQAGVECPNPPCRQLKRDLLNRNEHDNKLRAKERENALGTNHDFKDEQVDYPPKINSIIGGKDCEVCNDVLMGELGLNPMNLQKMRKNVAKWEERTNKMIEGKPNDTELKKHAITVTQCIHAFDRTSCIVDLEKTDENDRNLRGNEK